MGPLCPCPNSKKPMKKSCIYHSKYTWVHYRFHLCLEKRPGNSIAAMLQAGAD
ncbi:unnamed protein product [Staurois parvus]|uniref:Uncharacterized protein n=1 Tax=Staurois parvus TaxID=386267 RepID=A0ABN9BMY1_9NEOB|nr:unnamed protein product [Staurois parvus]